MTANEAISALAQIANIFRATQDLMDVLEIARQVESNKVQFDAEVRQLVEDRVKLAKEREVVEKERTDLDAKLSKVRTEAQQATAGMLEAEQQKREGYERQSAEVFKEGQKQCDDLLAVKKSLEAQRDALLKEIHELEDKRDDLKGIPTVARSFQVRLPNE